MGRSGRLAVGAIAAAVCAGQVAPEPPRARSSRWRWRPSCSLAQVRPTRSGARRSRRSSIGAGLIAVRIVGHAGRAGRPRRAAGRRRAVGARRRSPPARRATASRPRRSARRPDDDRRSRSRRRCRATRSSSPATESSSSGAIRPRPDSPYGDVPGADRRRRDADLADARARAGQPTTPVAASRRSAAAPPRRWPAVLPEPEAGLAAGHPDRPPRPRRPRPRRGVHDGRRQPRRGDLRLEHRDRRGGDRRPRRAASGAAAGRW